MTLAEGLGISWRYLSHIVTERKQLASNIVRRHTSLDPDQAPLHIRKPGTTPPASKLLSQNDRPYRPIKCNVFLPVSIPIVLTEVASVCFDMAMCSSCFDAPIESR